MVIWRSHEPRGSHLHSGPFMIRSQNGPDRPPSTFRRSRAPARAPDRHQWCFWCTLGCWLGCWGARCMRAGMCCHILGRKAQEKMCASETSWRAPASSGAGTRWLGVRAPTCMTQGRAVAPRIGGGRAGKRLRGRSGARERPRVLARATLSRSAGLASTLVKKILERSRSDIQYAVWYRNHALLHASL